jgi:hypothetical protein
MGAFDGGRLQFVEFYIQRTHAPIEHSRNSKGRRLADHRGEAGLARRLRTSKERLLTSCIGLPGCLGPGVLSTIE